ncbi:tetratricopeptide repeat protein [Legionella sp. CNM-4043-24]|uniref:tetratricopeptide repeat protein n=1 Tax=Legionella sp. CNM-4043-24 TaxID=3421646 RepID=UPI00403A82E4
MTLIEIEAKLQRYLQFLAQDENNPTLLKNISLCYRQLSKPEQAQLYLTRAKIQAGKDFWTEQGLLYLDAGNILLAKEALTNALSEEDTPISRYQLAFCLFLNQEHESALALLESLGNNSNLYESDFLKARLYHCLKRPYEARLLLEDLFRRDASHADVCGLLALMSFDENNMDEAELFSRKCLEANPRHYEGRLVNLLLSVLKNEAGVREINDMLDERPGECRLWFALGMAEMQNLNMSNAAFAFKQTTTLWPQAYDCWISLAWCQLFQNDVDDAEHSYQQAMAADPEQAEALAGMALVYALRKNTAMANQWLMKSKAMGGNCFLAAITEIIMANEHSADLAADRLMKALPGLENQMDDLLNQVEKIQTGKNTVH